jgi:hypothetical protein
VAALHGALALAERDGELAVAEHLDFDVPAPSMKRSRYMSPFLKALAASAEAEANASSISPALRTRRSPRPPPPPTAFRSTGSQGTAAARPAEASATGVPSLPGWDRARGSASCAAPPPCRPSADRRDRGPPERIGSPRSAANVRSRRGTRMDRRAAGLLGDREVCRRQVRVAGPRTRPPPAGSEGRVRVRRHRDRLDASRRAVRALGPRPRPVRDEDLPEHGRPR